MTQNEHLLSYEINLKTVSPIFIGDGFEYKKTDYIFNEMEFDSNTVSFIDNQKLFNYLIKNNLEEKYERFILSGNTRIENFLNDICDSDLIKIKSFVKYSIDASDALDAGHSLKNIQGFIKNCNGKAYIPGSSLKGVIRTLILFSMINEENIEHDPSNFNNKSKNGKNIKESNYLNTLKFKSKDNNSDNMINSIMRGIYISDSNPIDNDSLILAKKIDMSTTGGLKELPLVRECIRPETTIKFNLTFDESVLHGKFNIEYIKKSIFAMSKYYYDNYIKKFSLNSDVTKMDYSNVIYLGGGIGYFSKALTYPYYGRKAIDVVQKMFCEGPQSKKHHHELDVELGISPHMLKFTKYKNELYPFGMCEVNFK